MRLLTLFVLIASFLVALAAASGGRSVIVSYPSDTPDSVLDQAKEAIINAGGTITHEYRKSALDEQNVTKILTASRADQGIRRSGQRAGFEPRANLRHKVQRAHRGRLRGVRRTK